VACTPDPHKKPCQPPKPPNKHKSKEIELAYYPPSTCSNRSRRLKREKGVRARFAQTPNSFDA
jgi:hypothetical protein